MIIEAAEAIVPLLRGEVVNRRTDWVTLRDAPLQLRPCSPDGIEVAVASTGSPTGAVLAGRLGLGLLSVAATDPSGFDALDTNWEHYVRTTAEHGHDLDRRRWRVVASMHLAETREQAWREMEHGVLTLCGYMEGMSGGRKLPWTDTPRHAVEHWPTEGFPIFGVATVGTPDDALATIERLGEKTGGFGTFLFLAHDCADWEATKRSYRLFAEHVIPRCRDLNANRRASIEWVGQNAAELFGAMHEATLQAMARYERPTGDQKSSPVDGSMRRISSGPRFFTEFTSLLTGCTTSRSLDAGTSSRCNTSGSWTSGSSQVSHASGGRITGIRSWIGAMVSLAVVVMMVQERMGSTSPAPCQISHMPAKASGDPSAEWMNIGCLSGFAPGSASLRCHS
jgi:hypothetical protein